MTKISLLIFLILSFGITGTAQRLNNPVVGEEVVFEEVDGMVAVEAEFFYKQSKNDVRQWYRTSKSELADAGRDEDGQHCRDAGYSAYLEILPDTRISDADKLIASENFSNKAGEMGVIHYKVKFSTPGRYYVWVRAFSTGSEDNGIHVGINGDWPDSGQRMQWCDGKNSWRWESKQRTEKVHCGEPYLIYLDIPKAGVHEITFSMREDGFEMDRFILTNNIKYTPEGEGPAMKVIKGVLPAPFPKVE